MVNAGDVVDCGVVNEDFEVKGTNSFAVGVFSQGASVVDPTTGAPNQQGDPDQSLAIAVEQYREKYVFLAPSDYAENYAVVIEPAGTMITLDGMPASGTATPIGSSGFSVLRLSSARVRRRARADRDEPRGSPGHRVGAYTATSTPEASTSRTSPAARELKGQGSLALRNALQLHERLLVARERRHLVGGRPGLHFLEELRARPLLGHEVVHRAAARGALAQATHVVLEARVVLGEKVPDGVRVVAETLDDALLQPRAGSRRRARRPRARRRRRRGSRGRRCRRG